MFQENIMKLRLPRASVLGCLFFFLCAGIAYGQFTSRMPALKAQTLADEAQIGMALLAFGIGSIAGFISVGPLLRFMQSRTMLRGVSALLLCMLVGMGFSFSVPVFCFFCLLFGFCTALFDVCMNTQAILLEIRLRHSYMAGMHAFYSVGCLLGSLLGATFAALNIAVYVNFPVTAVLLFAFWYRAGAQLQDDIQVGNDEDGGHRVPFFILFCGFMALCAFISEGSVAEWGGLLLHSVKGADEGIAALCYGVFSALMATARLFGDRMREHYGDFPLLLGGTLLSCGGMALVLASPWPVVCLVGYALMGLGLAPVMPVVLSRAGSSGRMSPKAASAVVSLFGYSGLLVVPPALGFVARHAGLATALLTPLFLCMFLVAGSFAFRKKAARIQR